MLNLLSYIREAGDSGLRTHVSSNSKKNIVNYITYNWQRLTESHYFFSFCRLCIMKYFLGHTKNCPMCRKELSQDIEEFSVNRLMDELSRKISPKVSEIRLISIYSFSPEILEDLGDEHDGGEEEEDNGKPPRQVQ